MSDIKQQRQNLLKRRQAILVQMKPLKDQLDSIEVQLKNLQRGCEHPLELLTFDDSYRDEFTNPKPGYAPISKLVYSYTCVCGATVESYDEPLHKEEDEDE